MLEMSIKYNSHNSVLLPFGVIFQNAVRGAVTFGI